MTTEAGSPRFRGKERVTSFSQVEAHMANCSYDFAHFDQLLFSFCGFSLHFQWSEVVVSSRTVAMDLIERQESRYTQVRTTKIREMRGPGLLERRGRIFIRSRRHVLLFARSTSKKAVLLGLSTQVSAGK